MLFGLTTLIFAIIALSKPITSRGPQTPLRSLQQTPSLPPSYTGPLRELQWGKINFLHTTDTHAWYAGHLTQENYGADWGDYISFVRHLRAKAAAEGVDLLVVDSGDKHDGNGLSDASSVNGEVSTPFFVEQDFDLLSIGNHELYLSSSSYQEYETVVSKFGERYLAANVQILINDTWTDIASRYRKFTTPALGTRILAFGFLFDFARFNPQTRVRKVEKTIKEQWFHDMLKENVGEVDMIVIVGHIPVQIVPEFPEILAIHGVLREYYPDTVITYFGGHSHIRDFTVLDEKSVALQSGRYCETVGFLGVDTDDATPHKVSFSRRYIDFNLHSFYTHSNKSLEDFHTKLGKQVTKKLEALREQLGITRVYGYVPQDYLVIDNSYPGNTSLYTFLEQNVLVRLEGDGKNKKPSSRSVMINSGSIRYDLYKGPFTKDTMYIVSPFQNKWLYLPNVTLSTIQKVVSILNGFDYIVAENDQEVNVNLLGPILKLAYASKAYNMDYPTDTTNLTKGYVTCDDYGCDGDDTPHIPYAIGSESAPNIVKSIEIVGGNTESMDLVFYDFLQPYILYALKKVEGDRKYDFRHYGGKTVGEMLKDFVIENWSESY